MEPRIGVYVCYCGSTVITVDKADGNWTGKEGFVSAVLKEESPFRCTIII